MPSQETPTPLTPLELRLMQVLWRHGPATVAAVRDRLPPPQLAYTTIQTMLNILERKGKLQRELHGRAFLYKPTLSETGALGHAVRDLVDRMFGGSGEELVMNLLQTRQLDPARLADLTDRLRQLDDDQPRPTQTPRSAHEKPEDPQS